MSKYNTIEVWNKIYGKRDEAYDYSGRLMKKSACGNPNSKFHPTLEHIRPLANGGRFHAIRVRGSRVTYEIVEDED